jgi:hypothetical protein
MLWDSLRAESKCFNNKDKIERRTIVTQSAYYAADCVGLFNYFAERGAPTATVSQRDRLLIWMSRASCQYAILESSGSTCNAAGPPFAGCAVYSLTTRVWCDFVCPIRIP